MENRHHVLFSRRQHSIDPNNRYLRNNSGLIVPMEIDAHTELHKNCPLVPPLPEHLAQFVLSQIKPRRGDYLGNMDKFLLATERAMKRPRTHIIEKEMARVTLHAVEIQKPFIQDGAIWNVA